MQYKAVIAGASGLVGGLLLEQLLQHPDYSEVLILVRKTLPIVHSKLKQLVVNFEHLDNYQHEITGHALFCCLGTTKSKTPDLKEYRKIDHDYPVALAKIAAKNSMQQFHLISALGANVNSSIFYSKLKGETEATIENLQLNSLYIYQPSLLVGNRTEKRFAEQLATKIFKFINPLLTGSFKKYRSIKAETVAEAMLKQSLNNASGISIYPSDQIKNRA